VFVGKLNTLVIEHGHLAVFDVKVEPTHSTNSFLQQNMTAADGPPTARLFNHERLVAKAPARLQRESHGAPILKHQAAIHSIKPETVAEPLWRSPTVAVRPHNSTGFWLKRRIPPFPAHR
jgi:hypothetical protein